VLLPMDTKSKQDTNQNTQTYVDLMLICKEDAIFEIVDEATLTNFLREDARIA
jgi:hypothetical protein